VLAGVEIVAASCASKRQLESRAAKSRCNWFTSVRSMFFIAFSSDTSSNNCFFCAFANAKRACKSEATAASLRAALSSACAALSCLIPEDGLLTTGQRQLGTEVASSAAQRLA